MNVLIYSQYWQKGGIEKVIEYLTSGLADDYNFSILTEDVPDPENQFEFSNQTKIYYRLFSPFNEFHRISMRKFIIDIDPDVIIVMGANRALYKASRAVVGLDYPVIISEHQPHKQLLRKLYNDDRFLTAIRDLADYNHVIFPQFIETYYNQDKVKAIPNPIIPLTNRANMGSKKIVNIARYDLDQKQQDVLVRAFALLSGKYPDWTLDLYGGDWFGGQQNIKDLVSKLNMTDRINVYDATDDVGSVLETASIFAFPSAYEAFGLVVGEAFSVGLPVVGFANCDGVNQLIRNESNGILVDSNVRDYRAFSVGLDMLMNSQELREQYSCSALSSIKAYSMDIFLTDWKKLIDCASQIKGKNRLKNLSDMELGYINYVASGYFFDVLNKRQIHITTFKRKLISLLRKLGLEKTARSIYRKIKSGKQGLKKTARYVYQKLKP